MFKKQILIVVIFLTIATLGCTLSGSQNNVQNIPRENPGFIAGFPDGIVHGFLSIFSLLYSIINNEVNMYEVHNNGWSYNLGFLLGFILFIGVIEYLSKKN